MSRIWIQLRSMLGLRRRIAALSVAALCAIGFASPLSAQSTLLAGDGLPVRLVGYNGGGCCNGYGINASGGCPCQTVLPGQPGGLETTPSMGTTPGAAETNPGAQAAAGDNFPGGGYSAGAASSGGGGDAATGGYIDPAVIATRMRVRFDSANGANSDRAEFLYATSPANGGPNVLPIRKLAYNEVSTYFEYAFSCNFSAFVETPYRANDVSLTGGGDREPSGFGDMTAGFRYALMNCDERYLTFQFKTFIPTGDEVNALGTGHVSLQPGLLYQNQLTDKLTLFAELHDWIGIGGTPGFTGNVLRYGAGTEYDLWSCGCGCKRLGLVTEVVGWTVLQGRESLGGIGGIGGIGAAGSRDASGETIVNAKIGLRYTAGPHSLYVGYGQALTDEVWYQNIARVEYEWTCW